MEDRKRPAGGDMPAIRHQLEATLERHGVGVDAADRLSLFLDFLATPEAPTAVHDPREGVRVHIADSLAGLEVPEVRDAGVIADLGAGAGLPGLVLAAVLPHTRVVVVESATRKCEFQRSGAAAMGLANVHVVWGRAEEWRDGLGRCDVVCARALAALPVLCEYAAPLLREGGVLVAWKGAVADAEAADAAAAAEQLGLAIEAVRRVVPFPGSERRTLHVVRKIAPTPAGFPRRAGIATKRPLTAKKLR
jgi:16S rRNA (guanine527-N7)-methyltransferase